MTDDIFRSMSSAVSEGSLFERCKAETDEGNTRLLVKCIADSLELSQKQESDTLQQWSFVNCGALVFFMQVGFAMLCAGCVRKKNVRNTMLKNLLDACGSALAFFCVGYGLAFGGQNADDPATPIGTTDFFSTGPVNQGFWFFQFAFSATCVTIVAGTLAERCQMAAYLCYSVFLTGFVYPVVAHTIWSDNGYLSHTAGEPFRGIGVVDFAGSGVIHVTGGFTALIATYILGARRGRFHDARGHPLRVPRELPGHSIALQLMGTMILWFGWYGFNPGSALLLVTNTIDRGQIASLAAVNTSFAAAAGGVAALLTNLYNVERSTGNLKYDLSKAMNGILSGLVAVTAAAGTIENWAAVCIGLIAGVLYLFSSYLLVQLRLDDAVDAIPVHLFSGMWGMVASGLFSAPRRLREAYGLEEHVGFFYSLGQTDPDATLLGNQVVATIFILVWVSLTMIPFFGFLNFMGWFRADSLDELVGLDKLYMEIDSSVHLDGLSHAGSSRHDGLPREQRPHHHRSASLREAPAAPRIAPRSILKEQLDDWASESNILSTEDDLELLEEEGSSELRRNLSSPPAAASRQNGRVDKHQANGEPSFEDEQ